jgi:hypothetical protein
VWSIFGVVILLILLVYAGHYTENKTILFSSTLLLSILFTHISFRFIGKMIKKTRDNRLWDPIPLNQLMLNAPDILDFISRVIKRIIKVDVNFEASEYYNEWIAIVVVAVLILISVIMVWAGNNIHIKL